MIRKRVTALRGQSVSFEPAFIVAVGRQDVDLTIFRQPVTLQNAIVLGQQSSALSWWREHSPQLCHTATQVATHEILDNDYNRFYGADKSPIYAITSLSYDLMRLAVAQHIRTPKEFIAQIDELMLRTYKYQCMQNRILNTAIL